MTDCTVEVEPGVCKMNAKITAKLSDDMMSIDVTIDSPCEFIKKYAAKLKPIDPYSEMELPMIQNSCYTATEGTIPHVACPIPCAVLKAVEVAADLGLMKDVAMHIREAE
ncbi:MAG: hypothetical protein MJZ21_04075 [archaeon]|nr:hypothetical protein [archaeon]